MRGTSNSNDRGNTLDRLRRKRWLLRTFGDGQVAACSFCGIEVDIDTISVDRIVPGILGGRYTHDNIRPACGPCNSADGAVAKAAKQEGRRAGDG